MARGLKGRLKSWVVHLYADNSSRKQQIPAAYPTLKEPFSHLMFGGACLQKVLEDFDSKFTTVLDIGSGEGLHAEIFRQFGKNVSEVDFGSSEYFERNTQDRKVHFGNYVDLRFDAPFDLIWACHVLEHQKNVHEFLTKVLTDLVEGGILAITVPPMKQEIVGGHLTVWNAGLLIYNLVLAGFDCSKVKVLQYGYNISLILEKRSAILPELAYDKGDIERLLQFFPPDFSEPFDGDIREFNWGV